MLSINVADGVAVTGAGTSPTGVMVAVGMVVGVMLGVIVTVAASVVVTVAVVMTVVTAVVVRVAVRGGAGVASGASVFSPVDSLVVVSTIVGVTVVVRVMESDELTEKETGRASVTGKEAVILRPAGKAGAAPSVVITAELSRLTVGKTGGVSWWEADPAGAAKACCGVGGASCRSSAQTSRRRNT